MVDFARIRDLTHDLFDYGRDYAQGARGFIAHAPARVGNAYTNAARTIGYFPTKRNAIGAYRREVARGRGRDVHIAFPFSGDAGIDAAITAVGAEANRLGDALRYKHDLWNHPDFPNKEGLFFNNRDDLLHARETYRILRDYLREIPLTEENAPSIGLYMLANDRLNDAIRYLDRERDTPRYRARLRGHGYRNLREFVDLVHPDEYNIPVDGRHSNPPADSAWNNSGRDDMVPLIYKHRGWPPAPEPQKPQQVDINALLITTLYTILQSYANQVAHQAPRGNGPTPGTM